MLTLTELYKQLDELYSERISIREQEELLSFEITKTVDQIIIQHNELLKESNDE